MRAAANTAIERTESSASRRLELRTIRRARAFVLVLIAIVGMSIARGESRNGVTGRSGTPGTVARFGTINFEELSRSETAHAVTEATRVATSRMIPRGRTTRPEVGFGARRPSAESTPAAEFTAAGTTGLGGFEAASIPPSPPAAASFEALSDDGRRFNPDTHGAVGPNHIMTTLQDGVRIHDRAGVPLSTVTLEAFWSGVGGSVVYDPRVFYEPTVQRWVFTASTDSAGNNPGLLIAVSTGSDPTGNWLRFLADTDAGEPVFADGPVAGFNKDWVIVSANLFRRDNFDFSGAGIWVFSKASLLAGATGNFTFFTYSTPGLGPVNLPVPATTYDNSYPTNFLVSHWVGNDQGFGFLRLFSISGPVGGEVFNEYGPGGLFVDGAPIGNPPWDDYSPNDSNFAPQAGAPEKIYVGDARIQNAVFRNGTLWCAQTVFLPAGGPTRSAVQWWEFTPSATVLQRGLVDDPVGGNFFAVPSIAVNSQNDALVGYSRFSASQFPSANYAFHGALDGPGNLRLDTVLKSGAGNWRVADNGLIRWGDWSSTVVDPANDLDFWTIQEYAAAPVAGMDRWGTWWGLVAAPVSLSAGMTGLPSTVSAGASVTYTIRATNNGALPASGAKIIDTLPAGAGFVSATSTRGACGHTNGVVVCDFGPLPAGVFATVTLVTSLNVPGTATNRVVATANGPDVSPADNTATVITAVNPAVDIFPLIQAVPNPPLQGNNFTFAVTVTNRGPSPALGVTLTNTLPAGVTFLSFTTSQGTCARNGSVVTCALGTMNSMTAVNVEILVAPTITTLLTNVAVAVTTSIDAVPSNNSTSLVTRADIPPTLGTTANQTISEDGVLGPLSFTVGDAETPAANLLMSGFSSNPAIVPTTGIMFGGSGASRTITVTPAPDANGLVTIFKVVTDSDGASTTNSFRLNVLAANDRPQISTITNQTINEDTVLGPLAFTVSDSETSPSNLVVTATSLNPALVPNGNITLGGAGSNRMLTLVPLLNQYGSATISINVSDGSLVTNRTFVLTVNAVNDLPTINDLPNRSVNEDSSTGAIPISVNDVETPAASLVLGAASSNPAIVPTNNIFFAGTGQNRTVTITPAANQFGSVIITIYVTDGNGGSTNDSFVLTVNPVNDSPTLNAPTNMTILEDAGDTDVTLTGISPGGTNENQTLTITATSTNPSLIPNPKVSFVNGSSVGTISFAPVTNASGSANIAINVNDGAGSNNVVMRTFTVTVVPVNDPPFVTEIPDQSVSEDTATAPIPFTIGDVDSAIGTLSVTGMSSDTNLIPNANIVFGGSASNRFVTVTPATNQFGSATIQVFVTDGQATNVESFLLTVLPVNDAPALGLIPTQSTTEDSALVVSFTATDLETSPDQLTYTAISSNQKLLPNANVTFGGSGSARTLRVVPATNQFGSSIVQVNATDAGGATTSTTFVLNVTSVNDPPTLAPLPDLTLLENALTQSISLTGITAGAPNEGQTITISAASSNPFLIPNPTLTYRNPNTSGTLVFTPAPNASGTASITITVRDGDSVNDTLVRMFNVTVLESNTPPTISSIASQSILEDAELTVNFTVADIETPAAQLLVVAASSNEELIDPSGLLPGGSGANRTLTVHPLTNQFGSATITLTVTDGGGRSATAQFELQVQPQPDPPTISGLADASIPPETPAPFPFTLGDADTPAGELNVIAASSNPTLIPDASLALAGSGANRILTVRTAPNQMGSATITLTVNDGVLTNASSFNVTVNTNPVAPQLRIDLAGTNVVVSWTTNAGPTWVLQTNSNVVLQNGWALLGVAPSVADNRYQVTLPAAGEMRFFRLCRECGAVQPPSLAIAFSGGNIVVSWPGPPNAYVLESRAALDAGINWSTAPEQPVFADGVNRVTAGATGPARYFRLRSP